MMHVEVIVLQIKKKKSHDTGVGTTQNLLLYLLINSFYTQKYSYCKSIFLCPISKFHYIHEWILRKFKMVVALKCRKKHKMDSKAHQINAMCYL